MNLEVDLRIVRPNGFTLEAKFSATAEALGIVGPSGCGKSTLLDAVAGILPGARVILDGSDLSRLPLEKRGLGYVTQDSLLFPHLSVRSNLLFSPGAAEPDETARALGIDHLLDRR
ncbi:MAG TPA: ATP-binding cassette domain-containing protein, partial [Planctomycetota bacterium]|nr:ATP-binding cassette domain-containing protein [Planctomycetota bacterium]